MGNTKYLFNGLLIIAALLLLYFGYSFLTKPSTPDVPIDEETGAPSEIGLTSAGFSTGDAGKSISDEFLTTLTGLRGLNLTGEVFADPVFQDLQDSNTALKDQTPGRPNPFAPIKFSELRFSNSTTTATSSSAKSGPPSGAGSSGSSNPLDQLKAR